MAHDPLTLLLWAWIAMAGWMAVLWLVELVQRNASLADVGLVCRARRCRGGLCLVCDR